MSCQESQAIASADEATTSRNRVYGALTTALRPIQLSRRVAVMLPGRPGSRRYRERVANLPWTDGETACQAFRSMATLPA